MRWEEIRGPEAVVEGAPSRARRRHRAVIFGAAGPRHARARARPTTQVVGMDEKPADALRTKDDSSLVRASRPSPTERPTRSCPREHRRDARGRARPVRRLPGVRRPAIAVPIPRERAVRARRRRRERRLPARAPAPVRDDGRGLRRGDPRHRAAEVRLLSIGEEPEKGNQLTLEAHALLRPPTSTSAATPRAATSSKAPPTSSSPTASPATSRSRPSRGRSAPSSRLREEIGARRPEARRPADPSGGAAAAQRLDPDTYGGAYLLGLRGLVVIAHGNSSPTAIANAIRLAARGVDHDVVGRLAARLSPSGRHCMIGALSGSTTNEVTWQRRARKSTSGSRRS